MFVEPRYRKLQKTACTLLKIFLIFFLVGLIGVLGVGFGLFTDKKDRCLPFLAGGMGGLVGRTAVGASGGQLSDDMVRLRARCGTSQCQP